MNIELLLENFELLLDSSDKIAPLNEAILNLAVRGKLVPQGPNDEPAPEPLGKYVEVVGGYAFKSVEYVSEGIPVIRISDFSDEQIDLSKVKYYKESSELERYELKEGDIIIAMTGGTIGKLAIVQARLGKLYLNQRVGKLSVINEDASCKEYIYWIARGVQGRIKNLGYGGAQPNVSNKQLEAMMFPFPPLNEQRRIVARIESLLDKTRQIEAQLKESEQEIIKLNESAINHLLEAENDHQLQESWQFIHDNFDLLYSDVRNIAPLRQAILQLAVRGKLVPQDPNDEPASELLEKIKAEKKIKEKKIKSEKPLPPINEDEIPYELPHRWKWVRLEDITKLITKGSSPNWQGINYVEKETGILFITSENVGNYKLLLDKSKYVEPKFNTIQARSILEKGDILMNIVGASIGRTALFNLDLQDVNINQAVCIIRMVNDLVDRAYLLYFFNSPICLEYMYDKQVDMARQNLSMTNVAKFLIPLPPLNEQKRIVEKVDKLMTLCNELEAQLAKSREESEKLIRAVLHEAFQ